MSDHPRVIELQYGYLSGLFVTVSELLEHIERLHLSKHTRFDALRDAISNVLDAAEALTDEEHGMLDNFESLGLRVLDQQERALAEALAAQDGPKDNLSLAIQTAAALASAKSPSWPFGNGSAKRG